MLYRWFQYSVCKNNELIEITVVKLDHFYNRGQLNYIQSTTYLHLYHYDNIAGDTVAMA